MSQNDQQRGGGFGRSGSGSGQPTNEVLLVTSSSDETRERKEGVRAMDSADKRNDNGFMMHKRILVWLRRDLRLVDNPALLAASLVSEEVVPVFIYAPEEEGQFQPGRCSRWWLKRSLESLDAELRKVYGSRLRCCRATDSGAMLEQLVEACGADAVFFNHLYDPISMVRDNEVKALFREKDVLCQSFNGDMLREPWEVVDRENGDMAYTNFECFWKAHQELGSSIAFPAPGPDALSCSLTEKEENAVFLTHIDEVGILSSQEEASSAQLEVHWEPGRTGGLKQLEHFVGYKLEEFSENKAKTDRKSTSQLSPYLHYGEVGVREVRYAIMNATSGWSQQEKDLHLKSFYKQLGFREYSRYLSFHFPFTHERAMLEHLRAVPWRYDQTLFKAWRTGNTGYPIVDAAMREIWSTGWMHNRCRVVCASFLVKYLLLPWQWGLKHFWDALLDADLECDTLGWQYCAGCLSDGHEFSMVMNLDDEVKHYDPKGIYVRRWIPALARLPTEYIHCPWKAPRQVLEDAGIELGEDYPYPVIEFQDAQQTMSKVADVVAQATVSQSHSKQNNQSDEAKPALSPYRPATVPLPEASSIVWGVSEKTSSLIQGQATQKIDTRAATSLASYCNNNSKQAHIKGDANSKKKRKFIRMSSSSYTCNDI